MPETVTDPDLDPYITSGEAKNSAGKLKPDVAYQVYYDIGEEAKRKDLEIKPGDLPEERERKNQLLKQLFDERSSSDLPDYQAVKIVDLEEKATRDSLTGLLNRRGFDELFRESLQQSNESGRTIIFLMLDLDHFKEINDTYGHLLGDQALKYLARALTDSVEIGDLIARWGGEEFVIAIKPKAGQPLDPDKMLAAAERIRRQIVALLSKDIYRQMIDGIEKEIHIPITLSVGATLTRPDDIMDTACQRADENLYKAKNGGRDQSVGDNGEIILTPVLPPDGRPEIVSS